MLFSESDFAYEICGISALKMLASKDDGVTRLYESDTVELNGDDRIRLRDEANIIELEQILKKMATSQRYKQVVLDSAVQTLKSLLSQVLSRLDSRQKTNEELLKQDDKSRRIERAEEIIKNLRGQESDRLRRLDNFLVSKDSENQKGLKEYVGSRLKSIYESICKEVDDKIKVYEDLDRIDISGFGRHVTNILNADVIPDLDQRISLNLSHLYEMGIQRAAEYSVAVSDKSTKMDFNIEKIQETFKAEIERDQQKILKAKSEIQSKQNKKVELRDKIEEGERQIEKTVYDAATNERERSKAEREYSDNIARLGRKPDIEKWKTEREVVVKQSGIIGWVKNIISPQYKTVYEEHEDDSAQREWMRKKKEYDAKIEFKRRELNKKKNELENRKRQLQVAKSSDERQSNSLDQSIKILEREIETRREIIKNNKNEACQIQKKRLKERIENGLTGLNGGECVLERLNNHIAEMSESHMDAIRNEVHRYYLGSIEDKIKLYQNIIDNNSRKLEEQYMTDKNDWKALSGILDSLKQTERRNAV